MFTEKDKSDLDKLLDYPIELMADIDDEELIEQNERDMEEIGCLFQRIPTFTKQESDLIKASLRFILNNSKLPKETNEMILNLIKKFE